MVCETDGCFMPVEIGAHCAPHGMGKYLSTISRRKIWAKPVCPVCDVDGCTEPAPMRGACLVHCKQRDAGMPMTPVVQRRRLGLAKVRRDGLKECSVCRTWLDEERFSRSPVQEDGLTPSCKDCARDYTRLRTYRLTRAAYEELLASQGGVCAICRGSNPSGRALAVDHDHACCPRVRSCGKCIRGLLCTACNTGVGSARDDVAALERMAYYLDYWNARGARQEPAKPPRGKCGPAWTQYKLSTADHAALLTSQAGCCAVCGDAPAGNRRLDIDHDHACCDGHFSCGKCVRGLLCNRCNRSIGSLRDNAPLVRSAIAYLRSYVRPESLLAA